MDQPFRVDLEFPRSGQKLSVCVSLHVSMHTEPTHRDQKNTPATPPRGNIFCPSKYKSSHARN